VHARRPRRRVPGDQVRDGVHLVGKRAVLLDGWRDLPDEVVDGAGAGGVVEVVVEELAGLRATEQFDADHRCGLLGGLAEAERAPGAHADVVLLVAGDGRVVRRRPAQRAEVVDERRGRVLGIISPEWRPLCSVRNGGRWSSWTFGLSIRSTRRSLMAASSVSALVA